MPSLSENQEFIDFLISVENPRSKGRSEGTGRFHSFQVSDDEWNVGYGHKIDGPNAVVNVNGKNIHVGRGKPGLTQSQALQLLKQDIERAFAKAGRDFNSTNPYEDGTSFEQLSETEQMVFTEIVFNVGNLLDKDQEGFGWPKLANNLRDFRDFGENREGIFSEITREGLDDRNTKLAKFYDSKFQVENDIFKIIESFQSDEQPAGIDMINIIQSFAEEADDAGVQDAGQTGENQEVEQEEEESIKLEPGVYERADGSLFEVNRNNEVVEKGNGPSQTSQ